MGNTAQTAASNRIAGLLDDGSFVEIGGYVTARSTNFNLQDKKTPEDGVLTGYGTIEGKLVYVYSQDASVLGGSIGEMHAKKIVRIYELAMKMGAPVIGLVDCAGLRLQEATDALDGFGHIYTCLASASGVIPQITAIFGTCGGGMAIVPALGDFTFMEEKRARLFVNSPNTLACDLGSAKDTDSARFQSEESGLVDDVGGEASILEKIRALVSILPSNNEDGVTYDGCDDDLNRICPDLASCDGDSAAMLQSISDNGFFFETKKYYAKEMVTGFIKLNGLTIGAVANRTKKVDEEGQTEEQFPAVLTVEGAWKAAEFVNFCDAFDIPVVTLTHVTGYKAEAAQERGIARAMAALTYAFAGAAIPKVNVVVGEAYGTAYIAMNSRSVGADLVYAWPNASIGMMDATAAAKIIYADEIHSSTSAAALIREKAAEYADLQSSVVSAAQRGYVDDIIEPEETRKRLIAAFEMLYTKSRTVR